MSEIIHFYSTNLQAPKVRFEQALLKGLAPDRGLYMPEHIPALTKDEIDSFANLEYHEIAFRMASKFLHDQIPAEELQKITADAYNFPVPLEKVYDRKYLLRLDQGPTASFKDFAARMMGRLMQYYLQKENREILILTATSGDTGSAIANAFYGLDNIKVVILYPEKEVTNRQRKQMTTLHKNIRIISIDGKFDDCQALVKKAFNDRELDYLKLSSANSINIGRLIPQSIYYAYSWSKLAGDYSDQAVVTVPSGNFGNVMGGILAKKMGIPIKKFVIATNANDEVPVYWQTGDYQIISPSINCISSAMNVGHPSNMARIVALYGGEMNENGEITRDPDMNRMRKELHAVSVTDDETRQTIKKVWQQYKILLEPHGAVGWTGMIKNMDKYANDAHENQLQICLETAHPAKFPEEIESLLGIEPELPPSLATLDNKEEKYDQLAHDYNSFKAYLKKNYD
jgi:threonine synthase